MSRWSPCTKDTMNVEPRCCIGGEFWLTSSWRGLSVMCPLAPNHPQWVNHKSGDVRLRVSRAYLYSEIQEAVASISGLHSWSSGSGRSCSQLWLSAWLPPNRSWGWPAKGCAFRSDPLAAVSSMFWAWNSSLLSYSIDHICIHQNIISV